MNILRNHKKKNNTLSIKENDHYQILNNEQQIYVFSMETFELVVTNEPATKYSHYYVDDLSTYTFLDLVDENSKKPLQSLVEKLHTGIANDLSLKVNFKKGDHSYIPVMIQLQIIRKKDQSYCLAIVEEITDETRVNSTYTDFSVHNPGKLMFYERLKTAISQANQDESLVCILMLDLDRFKNINHSFGKKLGDDLLKKIPDRLQAFVRENDTFSRFEGDEYFFIFRNLRSINDAIQITERLIQSFTKSFHIKGHELFITPSIGMSIYPYDGSEIETLMINAETAMYKAKENGGNNYHLYNATLNSIVLEKLVLENNLRKAIESKEFILYYQPLVDAKSGEVVSLEALIRWNHPTMGIIAPSEFIPFAEEIGVIGAIGDWVLKEACSQLRKWHDMGYTSLSMSINLSALQFRDKEFQPKLLRILKSYQIDPQFLNIEITETSAMEFSNKCVEIFNEFKKSNFKIYIDDFGIGYSSLSYLKQWTIDILKIDKSFIREIVYCSENKEIVSAIINLAHALGIKVIAEGVENQEQMDLLLSLNCDVLQGYYISVPLPKPKMEHFLLQHSKQKLII